MSSSPPAPHRALAARLIDDVRGRPTRLGSTRLLCIDGPSGSGKTTLADIAGEIAGAPVVHLDDLYRGWDGLPAVGEHLAELLAPLATDRPGTYRRYDWHRGELAETVQVAPAPILIVEGVGAGQRRIADWISLLVWVEAPPEQRRRRALDRDGTASAPHLERWWRAERIHFAADDAHDRADASIDTADVLG